VFHSSTPRICGIIIYTSGKLPWCYRGFCWPETHKALGVETARGLHGSGGLKTAVTPTRKVESYTTGKYGMIAPPDINFEQLSLCTRR
jgi:hypothetical protein